MVSDKKTGEIYDDQEVATRQVDAPLPFLRAVQLSDTVLDELGRELLDATPIAPPVGYVRQPSLTEQIRNMVRAEALRRAAEEQDFETWEEANDFDVDDAEPRSIYEGDLEISDAEVLARYPHLAPQMAPQEPPASPPASSQPPVAPAAPAAPGAPSSTSS